MITTRIAKTLAGAVFALLGLTVVAMSAPAYITLGTELRAGPGVEYPPVAGLPPGMPVEVFGCLQGWSWCDVAAEGTRGWVYGGDLQISYGDRRVLLPGYAPVIGLPVIGFDFGDYWGRYYRDRLGFATKTAGAAWLGRDMAAQGMPAQAFETTGLTGPATTAPAIIGPKLAVLGFKGTAAPASAAPASAIAVMESGATTTGDTRTGDTRTGAMAPGACPSTLVGANLRRTLERALPRRAAIPPHHPGTLRAAMVRDPAASIAVQTGDVRWDTSMGPSGLTSGGWRASTAS